MDKTVIKWNNWTGGEGPPVAGDLFIMRRNLTVRFLTGSEARKEEWRHYVKRRDIIKYSPVDYFGEFTVNQMRNLRGLEPIPER
jgi:hypothetical protein